ncbi:MAG: hypothetical protein ACM3ZF_16320 [Mycobacterium leprae]
MGLLTARLVGLGDLVVTDASAGTAISTLSGATQPLLARVG